MKTPISGTIVVDADSRETAVAKVVSKLREMFPDSDFRIEHVREAAPDEDLPEMVFHGA